MTWTYHQSTGELYRGASFEGTGYSGHGDGVNNPHLERVPRVGPIPEGAWTIGAFGDHPPLGPISAPLTPCSETETFGRSGFFLHGDNTALNDTGSEGCIVMGRAIRQAVADSGDNQLEVVL